MIAVTCQDLSKTYSDKNALLKLNCTIAQDAITGIIGRNGAGKTTLLKCIAGFYRPTEGTIRVFGQEPYDNLAVSAGLIFVDETMTFPDGQSLAQILSLYSCFYPDWDAQLAEKLLAYFNLPAKQLPQKLSKGMLSTFRSIVGLCAHAPLTIMDEPTTGMDSGVRQDFYRALLKDYIQHPRTLLISSHLLAEIEDLLEYVLLLDQGQVLLHAPTTELATYALALSGQSSQLEPFLANRTILQKDCPLPDHLHVIIVNDLSPAETAALASSGITTAAVSINELCNALTATSKGGIDHVFA